MCGIFGVVHSTAEHTPDSERLKASVQSLKHRGPDSQAIYSAPGAGFGHTRLSFLDIDPRSDQPFWDASGRYALVYNGEIYNYRELKAKLQSAGVVFRTTSDTEVLLYWLLQKDQGVDVAAAIRALEGMFAFALYDKRDRSLLLARDRFGMKPLFIQERDEAFLFASETKAFRPWVRPVVDQLTVASYLMKFRGPTREFTFEAGVKSVSPGQIVIKRPGRPSTRQTFATLEDFLSLETMRRYADMTEAQTVDCMDELLQKSVVSHLLADVPVGAFCSGGVDSSLLMSVAARSHTNLAIFHANVKGRWSEYGAAAALSKHLNLDLKAVDVEEQDFVDYLPQAVRHFEQPFADRPNCVPMMLVAQLARDSGVKGLLSGEGSDECFLGYPWLGRRDITEAYYSMGAKLRSAVRKIPGFGAIIWPVSDTNGEYNRSLFNRFEIADDDRRIDQAIGALGGGAALKHSKWTLEHLHYQLRVLLHRNDTMGMAGSIESRFPFLDTHVVAAAVNLPGKYKLRFDAGVLDKAHPFTRDKWVVRRVADRYIPPALSKREKFGFWTTVFDRLQISDGYFQGSCLEDLLGLSRAQLKAVASEASQSMLLRLLHLDMWGRICIRDEAGEPNVSRLREHTRIKTE